MTWLRVSAGHYVNTSGQWRIDRDDRGGWTITTPSGYTLTGYGRLVDAKRVIEAKL